MSSIVQHITFMLRGNCVIESRLLSLVPVKEIVLGYIVGTELLFQWLRYILDWLGKCKMGIFYLVRWVCFLCNSCFKLVIILESIHKRSSNRNRLSWPKQFASFRKICKFLLCCSADLSFLAAALAWSTSFSRFDKFSSEFAPTSVLKLKSFLCQSIQSFSCLVSCMINEEIWNESKSKWNPGESDRLNKQPTWY